MLGIIGVVCIVVASLWIGYKLYVAFNSAGGTIMVAVYDAAIFPPLLVTGGLYALLRSLEITWPIWSYPAVCVGVGVAVAIGIKVAEEIGDRPL